MLQLRDQLALPLVPGRLPADQGTELCHTLQTGDCPPLMTRRDLDSRKRMYLVWLVLAAVGQPWRWTHRVTGSAATVELGAAEPASQMPPSGRLTCNRGVTPIPGSKSVHPAGRAHPMLCLEVPCMRAAGRSKTWLQWQQSSRLQVHDPCMTMQSRQLVHFQLGVHTRSLVPTLSRCGLVCHL